MNSTLNIRRLNATYLVSREMPEPDAVRHRLDGVVQNRLAADCSQILARALARDDSSLWLIRSLEIDLALDVSTLADDLIARALASQMVKGIAQIMAGGANGETVLFFPNRAAFLAQFILDMIDGQAWDKWYYRSFDGLRTLSNSALIREVLIREPQHTETVLLLITERGRMERLLSA